MKLSPLVIASHNAGKVREIGELLSPYKVEVISAAALNLPEPEETGTTFTANAELKALAACEASGKASLADDSGLVVPALDGAPGIYSARWAGPGKDFAMAMNRIETELKQRGINPVGTSAYFVCVLSLGLPDGRMRSFEGKIDGTLTFPARGIHGFGYDPIFIPTGDTRTFGEMSATEKHAVSHRAEAFKKFTAFLRQIQVE